MCNVLLRGEQVVFRGVVLVVLMERFVPRERSVVFRGGWLVVRERLLMVRGRFHRHLGGGRWDLWL